MKEKNAGIILVSKLRAILLLEAEFNALNKIVFNNRTMPTLESSNGIPYEVIGETRGQSSIHVDLNKKLICDMSNQQKKPSIVISADAANFYDRLAHPIASQAYQHFGVQLEYLLVLFNIIQIIRMFLRTLFGLSKNFYTSSRLLTF